MHHQIFIAIFTAFWLAAGSIAHAGDRSAVAVVEDLHGSLLAMMKKADVLRIPRMKRGHAKKIGAAIAAARAGARAAKAAFGAP